ncbi:MAG: DNA cytosine methyltransferase [Oscillatoriales cyanobacterium]|nr:MAG: DNA cytosine methyltransferase [Oscillatoriales cyanobacterium]
MVATGVQTNLFDLLAVNHQQAITTTFKFVDLFSGIGGFRIPLEQLGGCCVAYAEIDRDAIATYEQNFLSDGFKHEPNLGDVSAVDQLPQKLDLVVGGVPCQAWSIAGKTLGFDDPRGRLWFEVCRLVRQGQPKAFLFENVKGLTEPRHRNSLDLIVHQLHDSGYYVYWTVLNSYDFGLPQDRDRLFLVGLRNDLERAGQFQFPAASDRPRKLYEVLDDLPACSEPKLKFSPRSLFGDKIPASRGRFQKIDELNDFFLFSDVRDGHSTIHSWDLITTSDREKFICMTLLRNRRKKKYGPKDGNPLSLEEFQGLIPDLEHPEIMTLVQKEILREVAADHFDFENSKISTGIQGVSRVFLPTAEAIGTLTASGTRDFVATVALSGCEPNTYKQQFLEEIYYPGRFRSLTAQDYAKLQGFPETFTLHPNSSTAKKQFGNAVSVPVIAAISQSILQCF